jgi:hypothetical protein
MPAVGPLFSPVLLRLGHLPGKHADKLKLEQLRRVVLQVSFIDLVEIVPGGDEKGDFACHL